MNKGFSVSPETGEGVVAPECNPPLNDEFHAVIGFSFGLEN